MKAIEVTEPGAYWLWPNADWCYDSWMPLWVEEQCGRLAFYPAAFDYDIDPAELTGDVVGPIEPPAA